MNKDWQKQQARWKKWIAGIFAVVFGFLIGLLIDVGSLVLDSFVDTVLIFSFLGCLAQPLQVIIHECGHLVFGKLSGYRFGYFGVGSHVWLKKDGKIVHRRHSMPGAAGYCAMCVPETDDPPVKLFFLGGALMDAISAIVFGSLFLLTRNRLPALPLFFLVMTIFAIYGACNNAIPQKVYIYNDGYRLRSLLEGIEARHALQQNDRISNALTLGDARLKDMPEEWFAKPAEEKWDNYYIASQALNHADRLLDEHRFSEARDEYLYLLNSDADFSVSQRVSITADLLCLELLLDKRKEMISDLLDPFMEAQLSRLRKQPFALRTNYIRNLLLENDREAAEKLRAEFEKQMEKAPWQADYAIDLEMMDMALELYKAGNGSRQPESEIRRATMADLDSIEQIYNEIHDEIEAGRASIGWIRGVYPTRQTAEDSIRRDEMFAMELEGRIIAAGRINQHQGPEYDNAVWSFDVDPEDVMVLHTLVVSPGMKGRGFGKKFVAFYEDYARKMGCTALRIDTNAINADARALYKKLGYTEACIVPTDFNGISGVNLVCMDKEL